MRLTLEQLKAMSDEELQHAWEYAKFPFDGAADCRSCLVHHWPIDNFVLCEKHPELTKEIRRFFPRPIFGTERIAILRANLDEFYALRLFYDSLYPPSEPRLPSAEDLDAVAQEQSIAEKTS